MILDTISLATESLKIASSKNASLFKGWKYWWKNEYDDDRWKNHNGVKIDRKICFREDIDAFIRMHKLINLQNKVNNELKWLQSQSLKAEGVAEIQENILPEFSLMLLEGRKNACHKKITLGN